MTVLLLGIFLFAGFLSAMVIGASFIADPVARNKVSQLFKRIKAGLCTKTS